MPNALNVKEDKPKGCADRQTSECEDAKSKDCTDGYQVKRFECENLKVALTAISLNVLNAKTLIPKVILATISSTHLRQMDSSTFTLLIGPFPI